MTAPSNHPAAAYPTWLARPVVPLQVVIGPPGNGGAAHAAAHRRPGEQIIDLAAIIADLAGPGGDTTGSEWIIPALARRNERLNSLGDARACENDCITGAWLITGAPLQWQRDFWSALGAHIVLVDPGKQAAIAAAAAEGVPVKWVHRWYAEAQDAMAGLVMPAARQTPPPRDTRAPAQRDSASKRGYGSTHRVLRDKQLLREPHCRFCWDERQVKVPATVLDHIKPFRKPDGDMDYKLWGDPANHRSLCEACHNARGAQRNRPEKRPGAGTDGRPMDASHPWNRSKP